MDEKSLYAYILNLTAPWQVKSLTLDENAGSVTVTVGIAENTQLTCPTCRKSCSVHDHRHRKWRHLDTCQFMTLVEADVPRVMCPEHGCQTLPVPLSLIHIYPFCHSIESLLFIRVLHGITFGVITTVKGTISARLLPASRRGEGISFFSLAMGLAMVVGPWIGLNMARWEAFNMAFWLCTGVAAVGIILSLIMTVPPVISHADGSTPKMGFAAMFDRAALPFAMVTFFMTFSYAGVSAFLALYARELNLMSAASNFLLCYAIFLMICRTFTGNVCDKKGPKYVVYPCLVFFTVGLVVLGYTQGSIMMVVSGALIGIGYGSVTPVFQTQIISSVEPHKIGVANSLFFNAMDAGLALGACVMGMMVAHTGYRMIYLLGALLVVVAGGVYALQMKGKSGVALVVAKEIH